MSTYYNDNDPSAAAWLRELMADGLIPEGEVDERSILDVEPADLAGFRQVHFFAGIGGWAYALRLAGWPDDRPVWTGSPPCQPFSVAGLQLGRDDPRHLAPHFLDLVTARRPPILFGEQVASAAVFGRAGNKGMHLLWEREAHLGFLLRLAERELARDVSGVSQRDGKGSSQGAQTDSGEPSEPLGHRSEKSLEQERTSIRSYAGVCDGEDQGGVRGDRHPIRSGTGQGVEFSVTGQDRPAEGLHDGEHAAGAVLGEHIFRELGGRLREGSRARGLEHTYGEIKRAFDACRRELEEAPGWAWIDSLQLHLEDAGYSCWSNSAPACSVGAPHLRQRCFFGAYDLRFAAGGLADSRRASDEPRRHDVAGATREDQGAEEKRQRLRDDAGDGRDSRGVQHAACDGWQQRRAAPIGRSVAGGCGAVDPADGDDTRLQGRQLHTERADECAPRSGGLVDRQSEPGPVSGFWRDADWLFCTDGKWRPTEPGIQPLAHGVPGRVGLLRGAGNAIVPELAAEFIQAFERAREMTRAHA